MRKISANYIYTGTGKILKNGIIHLTDEGEILGIIDTEGQLNEENGLEFYNGVIVPGFVNVHCHLELSYLKGKIKRHTGLPGFINELQTVRTNFSQDQIKRAAHKADKRMRAAGITAVGDISNDSFTVEIKKNSSIKYINFIEVFGSNKNIANIAFAKAKNVQNKFKNNNLEAYIVPHAPYSLTKELYMLIKENSENEKTISTIHNQECASESDFFAKRSGKMYELFKSWGTDMSFIVGESKNSVENFAPYMSKTNKTLLIHNTYSKTEYIAFAEDYFDEVSWGLCPKANLYIENALPEINNFRRNRAGICIGTDSLAANNELSILSELIELQRYFPFVSFTESLKWATINGAKALGLEKKFGSIEKGKTPGINLITDFDFKNRCLKEESAVKVLV